MINILSIGELLWDIFPDKKILGGAPANFAFHARQFGSDATGSGSSSSSGVGSDIGSNNPTAS